MYYLLLMIVKLCLNAYIRRTTEKFRRRLMFKDYRETIRHLKTQCYYGAATGKEAGTGWVMAFTRRLRGRIGRTGLTPPKPLIP
jgi:hypothetical protein